MEYCPGSDLGNQIKIKNKIPESEARLYLAEIVVALEYLHKNKIIYRDLKPENVVLDANGHVKLIDFGLCKDNMGETDQSRSVVGSICYLAPEVLKRTGHTKSVDWYLCGVLLYEMLVGIPPFYSNNQLELFENIKTGPLRIPKSMSMVARTFILALLDRNPMKRLGALAADADEVKAH